MKFPKHECELILNHNPHKSYYESVEQHLEGYKDLHVEWPSEEAKKRAIDTNEIWELQWYPDTPIGFNLAAAPTLEELLEFVNSGEFE